MTSHNLGILGHPLTHSLSPLLHETFLELTGLKGNFKTFDMAPDRFSSWIKSPIPYKLSGFSVTIPYKTMVIPYLKGFSEEAKLIGAVNSVVVKPDGLYGENTDSHGFAAPLDTGVVGNQIGSPVLILGAGGASRAVAYSLLRLRVGQISLWARNQERAAETLEVINSMNKALRGGRVPINLIIGELTADVVTTFKSIINTTPIGMYPNIDDSPLSEDTVKQLSRGVFIYDLVYNPLETKLLKYAREAGLRTQDGLSMLVHQGAKSFELWTKRQVIPSIAHAAKQKIIKALEEQGQ